MVAKRKAKKVSRGAGAPRRRKARALPAGISRIDQDSTRTHGFFVRVGYHRTKEGTWRPKHRAFFGDASYGGRQKALKAALKWLKGVTKGRSKR
jgi:hypothetical protein